jgi:hypothetical protein
VQAQPPEEELVALGRPRPQSKVLLVSHLEISKQQVIIFTIIIIILESPSSFKAIH